MKKKDLQKYKIYRKRLEINKCEKKQIRIKEERYGYKGFKIKSKEKRI